MDVGIGERWVFRTRLPDGSATDVTGWVERVDRTGVTVRTAAGDPVTVAHHTVIVARRAPVARGGVDPRRIAVEELEHVSMVGWLADSEPLGQWTLRSGAGFTGRANSCHAVGDPGRPIPDAAAAVMAYAERHGIPPWASVVTGSAVERDLRALGWTEVYAHVDLLVARLADLLSGTTPSLEVDVAEELTEDWLRLYGVSRPHRCPPEVLRRILTGTPPVALATARPDRPAGIGRGQVTGDWLGIAAVWVDPAERRRGWSRRILTGLGHWAARRGARYAYLSVERDNRPALEAYGRSGFVRHHSYRYLAPPPSRVVRS